MRPVNDPVFMQLMTDYLIADSKGATAVLEDRLIEAGDDLRHANPAWSRLRIWAIQVRRVQVRLVQARPAQAAGLRGTLGAVPGNMLCHAECTARGLVFLTRVYTTLSSDRVIRVKMFERGMEIVKADIPLPLPLQLGERLGDWGDAWALEWADGILAHDLLNPATMWEGGWIHQDKEARKPWVLNIPALREVFGVLWKGTY